MTVGELILILQDMPQDADVYRLNEATDYYCSDTEELVTEVTKDEYNFSVTLS